MCLAEKSCTVTSRSLSLAEIIENYEYYDYDEKETPEPETRARSRRDVANNMNAAEMVTYRVCVRLVTDSHIFTCCR